MLRNAGYRLILLSNQSGIGRGLFTREQLKAVHARLQSLLAAQGVSLDAAYFCPHAPQENCPCRKPATGLLEAAGVKIKVLSIPDAKDPDEFIKKFGAERFEQLIEGSSSATDFAISKLRGENDVTTAEGKVSFLKQFAMLMAGLPNPIEREVYLSKICRELEVDKAAVAGQIEREQKKRSYRDRKKEERELISPPMKNTMNREDELLWRQHPREMKAAGWQFSKEDYDVIDRASRRFMEGLPHYTLFFNTETTN